MKFQSGNVLFIVLAGIALFAALVMAVTRSGNTDGSAVMSQAEAKLHAATIIDFGNAVEQAVSRLVSIGGCDISEVSFERSPFDGSDIDYVNPNSPADFSCHVFHPSGGQIEMIEIAESWLDGTSTTRGGYGEHMILVFCVNGAGNTYIGAPCNGDNDAILEHGDIIFSIPYIKEEICREVVIKAFSTDTIPTDTGLTLIEPYKGTFLVGSAPHISYDSVSGEDRINSSGQIFGCYTPGASGAFYLEVGDYVYYNTVFIR